MSALAHLAAAVFLPLFPLSMVFNRLFTRARDVRLRMGLLLLWPQLGVLALLGAGEPPPGWMVWWAVATAVFYALRTAALRDLGLWTGYIATSAWALLWLTAAGIASPSGGSALLILETAGVSGPFVLLAWLIGYLESELGAAYAGVGGGLAQTMPRLAGVLVLSILAAVATPLVPGFFVLLATTVHALPVMPGAAVLLLAVWLLWAWSGIGIVRGFIVGPASAEPGRDLGTIATGLLGLGLLVLVLAGISISGELI
jgi:NADH:ubiquinone oxidoreductase subunit 4 (subunit M)